MEKYVKDVNNSILGFDSVKDFINTLIRWKDKYLVISGAILAVLTSFIEKNIFHSAEAIYILIGLILFDTATGIIKAFKQRNFSSRRLPRFLGTTITYIMFLTFAFQLSNIYPELWGWSPALFYGGFVVVLLVSIAENMYIIGLIPKWLYKYLAKKLKDNTK